MVMAVKCGVCGKRIGPTAYFNGVKIISSEVGITETCANGWIVTFNREPALVKFSMDTHTHV